MKYRVRFDGYVEVDCKENEDVYEIIENSFKMQNQYQKKMNTFLLQNYMIQRQKNLIKTNTSESKSNR